MYPLFAGRAKCVGEKPVADGIMRGRMGSAPPAIYALVMLSGASGLIYEIVWIRALGLHFGTSTPAIATVTATFMAGLALGNWLFGRRADRSPRPLALYRKIELGVGVCGLGVSGLLLRGGVGLDTLARATHAAGRLGPELRALAAALVLLVPTTLMGGTLPTLTRALGRAGEPARALAGIYAANTLGATLGALAPDFWLIPHMGLLRCAGVAALGNLVVFAALPGLPGGEPTAAAAAAAPPRARAALALSALSGFAGMVLEVLWSRTLEHWTAAFVTSFAVLLAVYLLALALGAAATRKLAARVAAPVASAALLLAGAGVSAVLPVAAAPRWRAWQRALWPRPPGLVRVGLLHKAGDALLHAVYLEGAACLLMGAAFPFVARAIVRPGTDRAGSATGVLFTVNTLAGVAGALTACFVWLPLLGQQGAYLLAGALLTLGGAVAIRPRAAAVRSASAVAMMAAMAAAIAWLPRNHLIDSFFRAGEQRVTVREGETTTAVAAAHTAYGRLHYLELLTPGVSMSDTTFGARRYMGMMAHGAMFTAHHAERALLVCYGVGNTARSLLSHRELTRLDVVDIAREVLELSPVFAKVRGSDPLTDPRTRVIVDDGRHHLIVNDTTYDVITAEPPPPNHAGVVNLYSREFYRLARRRLRPGGVLTQWLPVFELSLDDARTMTAAFVAEFPHAVLLYGHGEQFILMGSDAELVLDPAAIDVAMRDPQLRADLDASGIADAADVTGAVLLDEAELRRFAAFAEPLEDDRPSIQYPWQPLPAREDWATRVGPPTLARARALLGATAPPARVAEAARGVRAAYDVLVGLSRGPSDDALASERDLGGAVVDALRERPGSEALLAVVQAEAERAALASARLHAAASGDRGGGPELTQAALLLGRRAYYRGDCTEAVRELERLPPEAVRDFLLAACRARP
jgi:spermidine synthase